MSIQNVLVTTEPDRERDLSAYRRGQSFDENWLEFIADRNPYAHFISFILPEQAIGLGFDLLEPGEGEEKLEISDKVWEDIKDQWPMFVYNIGVKRWAGLSILTIFKSDNSNTKGEPFLKSFDPRQIGKEELKFFNDGTLKQIKLSEPDPNTKLEVTYNFPGDGDLENVYYNQQRFKRYNWLGRSYLEPIWDDLLSTDFTCGAATLYGIRYGAGLKVIKIPEGTDPEVVELMKTAARTLESYNGWFLAPMSEAEITLLQGIVIDYNHLKMVALENISAYTGYPIAGFRGIEMERQGGEFNNEQVQDCWREIQRNNYDLTKWLILRLNDHFGWGLTEEEFPKIKFHTREVISERQQAELDLLNAQSAQVRIAAGITTEQDERDKMGIEGTAPGKPQMEFMIQDKGQEEPEEEDD